MSLDQPLYTIKALYLRIYTTYTLVRSNFELPTLLAPEYTLEFTTPLILVTVDARCFLTHDVQVRIQGKVEVLLKK